MWPRAPRQRRRGGRRIMSRTVRVITLALIAATTMLGSCRGDRTIRPADPLSSDGLAAWAKPSPSQFVQSLPTRSSIALRPLEEGGSIRPLQSLSAAAPGHSTNEACEASEWCGIPGDIVGGLVGLQCVSGPGACANASYRCSIRNAPPNSTTTLTPNPQALDQAVELIIQPSDATPPGIYQSTVVTTPVRSSPPSSPD